MTIATAVANIAMSLVYLGYGTMTLFDLKDGWRDRTRRHFGLGFLAIMWTCGPHHLEHGLHLLFTDVEAGGLDLLTVGLGLPAGVIWFALRTEALLGGRGDRHIEGTPRLMAALPVVGAVYLAITASAVGRLVRADEFAIEIVPNLTIMVLYFLIGGFLTATQLRNHDASGRWSLSGLSLAGVFLTCSLMHLVYAGYGTIGQYEPDGHILPIDLLAVPGAAFFLSLAIGVHRGRIGRQVEARQPVVPAEATVSRPPVGAGR